MNKMILGFTAALAATAAVAGDQIVSANVVGYQTKAFDQSDYNATIATFLPVSKDGDQMTLKDIVPNDAFWSSESEICFIKPSGANAKVEFGGKLVSKSYIYWKATDNPAAGEGWYLTADAGTVNQNDELLPFGEGFLVYRKSAEAAVTFSGQVSTDPTTKGFANLEYNACGNCSPTAIKLGDITCNEAFWSSESEICFIKNSGANAKVEFGGKLVSQSYIYWKASDNPAQGPGWYLAADAGTVNQNEAVEIAAGQGFLTYIKAEGAEITIPAAIEK